MNICNKVTSIVFCAVIAGLTVASMLNPVRESSETENRDLAQMPTFSLQSLFNGKFTQDYETFITDQFVARDAWIAVKTYAELALGKRDSNGVYFADDGYYIEKFTPDEAQIDTNIAYVAEFLSHVKDKYNTRVMIAPTSSLVLSDKLPANAPNWDQDGMLDRLASLGNFVDTRDILLEHKDEYIYYRTDHHWTTWGAYYAYLELAESLGFEPLAPEELVETVLSEEFLGTTIAKLGISANEDTMVKLESKNQPTVALDYNMGLKQTDTLYDESKLDTRDKYGYFLGGNDPIIDITTSVDNGRTLLMVKDSYAHCMIPLLVNHYERIILIDLRHFNAGVETYIGMLESSGTEIDDIVVLYNASGFADDRYLVKLRK